MIAKSLLEVSYMIDLCVASLLFVVVIDYSYMTHMLKLLFGDNCYL